MVLVNDNFRKLVACCHLLCDVLAVVPMIILLIAACLREQVVEAEGLRSEPPPPPFLKPNLKKEVSETPS